jgi:hypothetical protein
MIQGGRSTILSDTSSKDYEQNAAGSVVDRTKDHEKIGQNLSHPIYQLNRTHQSRPPARDPEPITPPPPIAQKQNNLLRDYPFIISFLPSIPE